MTNNALQVSGRLHTLEIYSWGKDFSSTPQSLSGRGSWDKYRAPDRNRQSTLVLQRAPSHDKFTGSTGLIPVSNNGRDHKPSPVIPFTSLKLILAQLILVLSPDRLLSLSSRYLINLFLHKFRKHNWILAFLFMSCHQNLLLFPHL
jgi:hypothetical protein